MAKELCPSQAMCKQTVPKLTMNGSPATFVNTQVTVKTILYAHMKSCHIQCEDCGITVVNQTSMEEHIKSNHKTDEITVGWDKKNEDIENSSVIDLNSSLSSSDEQN